MEAHEIRLLAQDHTEDVKFSASPVAENTVPGRISASSAS